MPLGGRRGPKRSLGPDGRCDAMLDAMGSAHDEPQAAAAVELEETEIDESLTAELRRRLDALLRGEARTVSRAEMKERLARVRATRPAR